MKLNDEQKNEIYEKEARRRVAIVKQAKNCKSFFNALIAGSALATPAFLYASKMVESKGDCLVCAGAMGLMGLIGVGGRLYSSRKAEMGTKKVAELLKDWKEDKYEDSSVWANVYKYRDYEGSYVVGDHDRFDPYADTEEQEPAR